MWISLRIGVALTIIAGLAGAGCGSNDPPPEREAATASALAACDTTTEDYLSTFHDKYLPGAESYLAAVAAQGGDRALQADTAQAEVEVFDYLYEDQPTACNQMVNEAENVVSIVNALSANP